MYNSLLRNKRTFKMIMQLLILFIHLLRFIDSEMLIAREIYYIGKLVSSMLSKRNNVPDIRKCLRYMS